MEKSTVKIRMPEYYRNFHCIGTACTDNCCHGWPIEVDKRHYLLYKAEKNPEFSRLCGKILHRIKKDATDDRYARMALDGEGRCGFQDPDGGCRMIRLLGEDRLSNTCTVYPRRKNEFTWSQWELSLGMSCEEAVRVGVLAPEMVTFITETVEFSPEDPLFQLVSTGIGPRGQKMEPPSWGEALRTVCISLMQMRQFRIPERLAAIFLLLRRLDRLAACGQEASIPLETIHFLQSLQQTGMAGFLETLQESGTPRLTAYQVPIGHLAAGSQSETSRAFLNFLEPWLERDDQGNRYAGATAVQALDRWIREIPWIEYERWMENYFVNYLYTSMFPFYYRSSGYSFEDQSLLLIQQYGLLRCLLATASGMEREEAMVKAAVHTARLCQHGDFPGDLANLKRALKIPDNIWFLSLLK